MKQAVLFLAILIPSALFAWFNRDMPQLGVHHDDSIYWVSAKALATGQGYRILSFPGEPFQTKYPPLYPALLSLVWKVDPEFPRNLRWATLLAWLMMPVYLLLVKRVLTGLGIAKWWSWGLTAAAGLNVITILLGISLMSELAFSVALLIVLISAERDDVPSWAIGLLAGIAFLLRSTAIPLAITVPICFWIRGRAKQAAWFLCGMLPAVAGWEIWVRFHKFAATDPASLYYTDYLGFHLQYVHFTDLPALFWANLGGYFSAAGQLLIFNPEEGFWAAQLARITCFAALMGVYRIVRNTGKIQFAAYGIGLSAMLLMWHYSPTARFVYALYPLLLAGLATEVIHVAGMLFTAFRKPKKDDLIAASLFGAAVVAYAGVFAWFTYAGLVNFLPAMLKERREVTYYNRIAYDWIRKNTAPDARFFAYDDGMLYLYTGRHAIGRPIPPDLLFRLNKAGLDKYVSQTPSMVKEHALDYVLLTDTDFSRDLHRDRMQLLRNVVNASPDFKPMFQSPHAAVYRYLPRPLDPPRLLPASLDRPAEAAGAEAAELPGPE